MRSDTFDLQPYEIVFTDRVWQCIGSLPRKVFHHVRDYLERAAEHAEDADQPTRSENVCVRVSGFDVHYDLQHDQRMITLREIRPPAAPSGGPKV